MENVFKSWKTTLIGIVALAGLAWNFYNNGGVGVSEFLLLVTGVGFIMTKDGDKSHSKGIGDDLNDPDEEEEPV